MGYRSRREDFYLLEESHVGLIVRVRSFEILEMLSGRSLNVDDSPSKGGCQGEGPI